MSRRSLAVRLRRLVHNSRLVQIGLIVALWALGQGLVRLLGLPLPGAIVGMVLALALLASGWLSLFSVQRGAEWLLGEMLLFFVPTVLAVVDHREFLGLLGLKVLAVILAGTAVVMTVTALTVDVCYRWRMKRGAVEPPMG